MPIANDLGGPRVHRSASKQNCCLACIDGSNVDTLLHLERSTCGTASRRAGARAQHCRLLAPDSYAANNPVILPTTQESFRASLATSRTSNWPPHALEAGLLDSRLRCSHKGRRVLRRVAPFCAHLI